MKAAPAEAAPEKATPAKVMPERAAAKVAKKAAKKPDAGPAHTWVEPEGGVCPSSHPVKVKLTSRIFHLPGMFAYARTRPDRCYENENTAAADGFTRARR